jgi:hypothetical protein
MKQIMKHEFSIFIENATRPIDRCQDILYVVAKIKANKFKFINCDFLHFNIAQEMYLINYTPSKTYK